MWRILIGFGCVPGALALLFRFTIPETPRWTMDIARNVNQASQDVDTFLRTGTYFVDKDARVEVVQAPKASWRDWWFYHKQRKNWFVLVGTCYSWFALDVSTISSPPLTNFCHAKSYTTLDCVLRFIIEQHSHSEWYFPHQRVIYRLAAITQHCG